MEGASSGIDGCYARWGEYHVFFLGVAADIAQERRFTRPCLSGEEERATGVLYNLECLLQLRIIQIYLFYVFCQVLNVIEGYHFLMGILRGLVHLVFVVRHLNLIGI